VGKDSRRRRPNLLPNLQVLNGEEGLPFRSERHVLPPCLLPRLCTLHLVHLLEPGKVAVSGALEDGQHHSTQEGVDQDGVEGAEAVDLLPCISDTSVPAAGEADGASLPENITGVHNLLSLLNHLGARACAINGRHTLSTQRPLGARRGTP